MPFGIYLNPTEKELLAERARKRRISLAPVAPRYTLDQDNDSHWYLIPIDRQHDWEAFCQLEGEDGWEVPSWATEVGGSPNQVTFSHVEIRGVPHVG